MLFKRTISAEDINPPLEEKKLILLVKKLLPDVVFNMASLEGNPFTYPEVQTLLDGITIGGHKVSDEQQIFNIRNGWDELFNIVLKEESNLNIDTFNKFNKLVAKDEALISGSFRTGQVRIAGTEYMPPKAEDLEEIFNRELKILIKNAKTKTDLAIDLFLWGSLNQFYYDGNKRTSRLIANMVLISNGQGILNIKAKDRLEFNSLMVEFYNSQEADGIFNFINKKCIERY
ncbi:MAG: Fic family protein [Clostridium sp.]